MIDTNKILEEQKVQLAQALTDLNTKVAELEKIKDALQSAGNDNQKLHYQEAGQWARHYSIVRMTIATFAIRDGVGATVVPCHEPARTVATPSAGRKYSGAADDGNFRQGMRITKRSQTATAIGAGIANFLPLGKVTKQKTNPKQRRGPERGNSLSCLCVSAVLKLSNDSHNRRTSQPR